LTLLGLMALAALGQQPLRPQITPNGTTYATLRSGDTTYIGGSFSGGGYYSAYLALTDSSSDLPDQDFPMANGRIEVAIPDSAGGWYIGGSFTEVAGQSARYLAHILPDYTLDPQFLPDPNGVVYALELLGDELFVGGNFTQISGQSVGYLARLSLANNGQLTSWQPSVNGAVYSIEVNPLVTVYIGGSFTEVEGIPQRFFAELRLNDGMPLETPSTNGIVRDIVIRENDLYLGGSFSAGGHWAPYLASNTPENDLPDHTFPQFNGNVKVIISDGLDGYYIGGTFTSVDGVPTGNLVHMLSDRSIDPAFNPQANGAIEALHLYTGHLYIGGGFSQIGGQAIPYLAKYDVSTNAIELWNPQLNNTCYAIRGFSATTLYAGGSFTEVAGTRQRGFAILDITTAAHTPSVSYNGTVYDIISSPFPLGGSGYHYMGGSYSQTGFYAPYCAYIIDDQEVPDINFPTFNGTINAIVSDGSGGYYLGGNFSTVDGVARAYLVHLLNDFTVDQNFTPPVNGAVRALLRDGNTLYVGGGFTQIAGQASAYVTALDVSTGQILPGWLGKSGANNQVYALELNGGTLYVGGSFTSIQGQTRNRLAYLNATNGNPLSPAPTLNSTVFSLQYFNGNLYAGGSFSTINGNIFRYLAAFNPSTGVHNTGFDPQANNVVYAMDVSGGNLRVGGAFTNIGGQPRPYLAELSPSNGAANTWNPSPNSTVNAIDGGYITGSFTQVGGQPRAYAAYVLSSGSVGSWDPQLSGTGQTILSQSNGTEAIVGGSFQYTRYRQRRYLSAFFYLDNQVADNWDVQANNVVFDLEYRDQEYFYAAGAFTQMGGQPRGAVAEVGSINPGGVSLFSPQVSGTVYNIETHEDTAYLAGTFTAVNGSSRTNLAALRNTNHQQLDVLDWNPESNGAANAVFYRDGEVLSGGSFTFLHYRLRRYGMAIDNVAERILDWDPQFNNVVYDLEIDSTHLYAAGVFTQVSGAPRSGVVRFNRTANAVNTLDATWNPLGVNPGSAQVYSMAIMDSTVYIGGSFDINVSGQNRRNALAFRQQDASLLPWHPQTNQAVQEVAINADSGQVLIGGNFTFLKYEAARNLFAIDETQGRIIPDFLPVVNSTVHDLEQVGSYLYVGGQFTTINTVSRPYLGRFDIPSGYVLDVWRPNANQVVYAMDTDGQTLAIGGNFTQMDGQTRNRVALFNTQTDAFESLSPNVDGQVEDINVHNGSLYLAGNFGSVDGQVREGGASMSLTGTLSNWNPDLNSGAKAIDVVAGRIYVGGNFTMTEGIARRYLAAFDEATGDVLDWDPSPNSTVNAILARDTSVYIAGNMTQISGQAVEYAVILAADDARLLGDFKLGGIAYALADSGNHILVGGSFRDVEEDERLRYFSVFDGTGLGSNPGGVNISQTASNWSIYPNPASEHLTVVLKEFTTQQGSYHLRDLQGRSILKGTLSAISTRIDLPALPAGTYLLELSAGNRVQRSKVMIQ